MALRRGIGAGLKKVNVVKRPLDFVYVIDTSGSMDGYKMESVNKAMHLLESKIKTIASREPGVQVYIRILEFGDVSAKWMIHDRTPIENFSYKDIPSSSVYGGTPFGSALKNLSDAFQDKDMPVRGIRPVIVLLSDGRPTDSWENNMNTFQSLTWVKKSTKIAIQIGTGSDSDITVLEKFTTNKKLVLEANKASDLVEYIKWTSTLITQNTHSTFDNDDDHFNNITGPSKQTMITDDEKML